MPLAISITLQDVYTKLRTLVLDVVPLNVQCIQGLPNRAAMPPPSPGFVSTTATMLTQHRTPEERWNHDDPDPDAISIEQGQIVRVQLDCYSTSAADWATMLAAVFRTEYGCKLLEPFAAPLYVEPPMQGALINGEEQYEERWIVGANLQYNPIVSTPMQFADTLEATLINVDEAFPP